MSYSEDSEQNFEAKINPGKSNKSTTSGIDSAAISLHTLNFHFIFKCNFRVQWALKCLQCPEINRIPHILGDHKNTNLDCLYHGANSLKQTGVLSVTSKSWCVSGGWCMERLGAPS